MACRKPALLIVPCNSTYFPLLHLKYLGKGWLLVCTVRTLLLDRKTNFCSDAYIIQIYAFTLVTFIFIFNGFPIIYSLMCNRMNFDNFRNIQFYRLRRVLL